jgi:hypothetical protein
MGLFHPFEVGTRGASVPTPASKSFELVAVGSGVLEPPGPSVVDWVPLVSEVEDEDEEVDL